MDEKTIELLGFNFNKTLRPRGDLLVRSQTAYNNDTIVGFMKMSDEEFVKKLDISLEKLKE